MAHNDVDTLEISFRFPFRISIAVLLVALALDVVFYLVTGSIEKALIFIGATTAAAGTVLAAFYSAKVLSLQLRQNFRSRTEYLSSLELQRKENAIRYGARWTDPNMQKPRKTCREVANLKGHSLEQVRASLDTDEKMQDVFHLLNFFEEMAASIKHSTSDESILKSLFKESLTAVWKSLSLWIEDYKATNDLKEAWLLTEQLYKSWDT